MSLVHPGNAQPSIDREEHTHIGDGETGVAAKKTTTAPAAIKVTESGDVIYIAKAAPGTAQSEDKWQCKKVDTSSGVVITWADGNSNYDNVATDLTSLSYE